MSSNEMLIPIRWGCANLVGHSSLYRPRPRSVGSTSHRGARPEAASMKVWYKPRCDIRLHNSALDSWVTR